MSNKDIALKNYYNNREKRIIYQREYDKNNKERKRIQDKKRYKTKHYNLIQGIRHYSQKNHYPILIKKYKGCQLKLDGCLINKRLQIHHKKYTKDINDCLLVCENCHKKIHRKVYVTPTERM